MQDSLSGTTVLVTGGAGFIGSHLVDALLGRQARVRVLDNYSTGRAENLEHLGDRVEMVEGDIRDLATCRGACDEVDLVFHQAALGSVPRSIEDPATTIAVNVGGTANVLAAAVEGGARRVVYASSSSVYGDSDRLPKKEGEEGTPLSPYAWSKRLTEELAEAFTGSYGLEAVGLRYFNVYGPRQSPEGPYAAVIPRFFDAFLNGRQPVIYGNGEQSRDFTAVGDAVRANLLAALANQAPGGAYNVGGGRRVTVNELARAVAGTVGVDTEPRYDPPRAGDVLHSLADLEAAGKRLDYGPETGLEQGLAPCNDYYRSLFA